MRKISFILILFSFVLLGWCSETNDASDLKEKVYTIIDNKTQWQRDKKIEIIKKSTDWNAIKWSWAANDIWHWIAWRWKDSKRTISIDSDWYNCEEIKRIPSEYISFFNITEVSTGVNDLPVCHEKIE